MFALQEGGRKSSRQPSKLEREGVVNIDDINLDQPLISEETTQSEDLELKAKQKRPYKRKSGQARIKDTTQSKKLKAEKKKAKKALKEKASLNRKQSYYFQFFQLTSNGLGGIVIENC